MPWPRDKSSSTSRGLGSVHRRERERLLPSAYYRPCPLCGQTMLPDQQLDLDHGLPRALGGRTGDGTGRIVHGACNRTAGARLARQLRARRMRPARRSRDW